VGGLLFGPSIANLRIIPATTVHRFAQFTCIRLNSSALYFVSTWGRSHHPSHFGCFRVVVGTSKMDPLQMIHVVIAVIGGRVCNSKGELASGTTVLQRGAF
jgi:hypothetical protein